MRYFKQIAKVAFLFGGISLGAGSVSANGLAASGLYADYRNPTHPVANYRSRNGRHHGGYRTNPTHDSHAYHRDCHPVYKIVYDHYGQPMKIGGTMCYDEYGNGYVVPGSRYLINHY